jgi:methyl-accepting chemotaxis protein
VLGITMPKRNGIKLPKGGLKLDARKISSAVTDAAKRADQIGQRVSTVASGVQQVSESAEKAAKTA